jgi:hypothetical protein
MAGDPVAKKAARRAPAKKAAAKKAPAKKAAAKRAPRKAAAKVVAPAAAAALAEIENPEPPADPWVRARAAHVALMGGDNWEAAASEHGFDDVRDCQMQVRAYLSYVHTMTGDEEREVAKRLELERLDAMHKQWWELGTVMRDKDAAQVLLAIGKRRAELLELTTMSQRQGNSQTIVITGDGGMADELRQMAMAEVARQAVQKQLPAGQPQHVVVDTPPSP